MSFAKGRHEGSSRSKRNGEFLTQRPSIFASRSFCSLRREEEPTARAFRCAWSQVDFDAKLIRLNNSVKPPGSAEPIALSQYARDVLQAWKKEQASSSEYVFLSPVLANRSISTAKAAWKTTLQRAGVRAFPIYKLRHVFCTRLSEAAPDAVVQRAMRHTSPETKRHYQLGMADQVRNAVDKSNKRLYGKRAALHFRDSQAPKSEEVKVAVCN
jgi:integrase